MAHTMPWRQGLAVVFRQQDWALLPVLISCAIALGFASNQIPEQRPVFLYDATISYLHQANTISAPEAPIVGLALLLSCLIPFEFLFFRAGRHWAYSVAAALRVLASFVTALVVVGMLTEWLKVVSGRLRPDFLDRCRPLLPNNSRSFSQLQLQYATFPGVACTSDDLVALQNGHKAFPSGHSSWGFAAGWYAAAYISWCAGWRDGRRLLRRLCTPAAHAQVLQRAAAEASSLLLLLLLLLALAWPWGVGITRFRDNQHHVSDVLGGFLLALTFVVPFFVRMVVIHEAWEEVQGGRQPWCADNLRGLPPLRQVCVEGSAFAGEGEAPA